MTVRWCFIKEAVTSKEQMETEFGWMKRRGVYTVKLWVRKGDGC